MSFKNIKILLLSAFLFSTSATSDAAPIDNYINMLVSKTYTIKCENITPATEHQSNRDKTVLTEHGLGYNDDYLKKLYGVTDIVIVSNGEHRYEEVGSSVYASCQLQKGNEVFNYTKVKDKNKYAYVGLGGKKGEVVANVLGRISMIEKGISYGDSKVTMLLNALVPNDQKVQGNLNFKRVSSGSLPNGLSYVDYSATYGGNLTAIRYYFQGDKMVKIASGEYYTDSNGKLNGERTIIKINEFSNVADKSYLELPEGLKDKTKRDKKD